MKGGAFLNASEASDFLSMSRPTFYRRHKRNLKRYRPGGKGVWKYHISDLKAIRDSVEEEAA